MKIKVFKTIVASKDPTGCFSFTYEASKIYDIYDELATVFIDNKWGELVVDTQEDIITKNTSADQDNVIVLEDINLENKPEDNTNKSKKKKKKST